MVEKSLDYRVLEAKKRIADVLNESNLPLTSSKFILTEITEIVEKNLTASIEIEKKQLAAAEKMEQNQQA